MSHKRKADLVRRYKNLSRVLTATEDLKIQISGTQAFRLPGLINLPNGDFSDDEFVTMSLGFADHEMGHERFTDHEFYEQAANIHPVMKHLLNIFDDYHQERRMMNQFPGCKKTLNALIVLCVKNGLFCDPKPDDSALNLLFGYLLYFVRCELNQPLHRQLQLAEQYLQAVMPDKTYKKLMQVVNAKSVDELKFTSDCFKLAEAVFAILVDEGDESQQPDESDDGNASDEPSENQQGKQGASGGKSGNDEQPEQDSSAGESDNEGEDSQGNGSDGDQDSDEQTSPDQNSNKNQVNSNQDSSESMDATSSSSKSSEKGNSQCSSTTPIEFNLDNVDIDGQSFDELLKAMLDEKSQESCNDGDELVYVPLPIYAKGKGIHYDPDLWTLDAKRISPKVKSMLKRKFHDLNYVDASYRDRGFRVSSHRLAGVGVGNYKIFNHEVIGRAPNTLVGILIDKSGSMNDQDMTMANNVAYAIAKAVDEISGASSIVGYYPSFNKDYSEQRITIAKAINEKVISDRFKVCSEGSTPTGEAMTALMSKMVNHEAQRKLLFVVTDGTPDDVSSTRQAVYEAETLGIDVFGIGIRYDIKGFEECSFCKIFNLSELVSAMNAGLKYIFS